MQATAEYDGGYPFYSLLTKEAAPHLQSIARRFSPRDQVTPAVPLLCLAVEDRCQIQRHKDSIFDNGLKANKRRIHKQSS